MQVTLMDIMGVLFHPAGLVPHGFCLLWSRDLVALHSISDALIGLSYYSIPVALVTFAKRRGDLAFSWMIWLFAAFILACGTTHFLALVTLWQPIYWLDGLVKAVTAVLSLATATILWPLIPKALALPAPAELKRANAMLGQQLEELRRTGEALRDRDARLAQADLRRTLDVMEDRFRRVVEAAPSAMIMVNTLGRIEMANAQAEVLFDYARDQLLGQPIENLVPDRFREHHPVLRDGFFDAPASRPMGADRDLYGLKRDGTEFPIEIGLNPIEMDDGTKVLSAILDISHRKEREERLQAALKEQEMLLSEVYHRVKNNLQVVCSLLDLQSLNISDPEIRGIFKDTQNRVRSMALIHQTLYDAQDFARADFEAFLNMLCPRLVSAYSTDPSLINLSLDASRVMLPITAAVPCGLIVNELISNALKHAFPNDARGTISVTLREEADEAILSVEDDGRGFPEDFHIETASSLGLQLVVLLARQIHATLTIEPSDPTRISLRFPLGSRHV